jgi:dTDP-4-amino-4,6-dideoxygalactose transaminase
MNDKISNINNDKNIGFTLPIQHNRLFPHQDDVDAVARVIASGYWACGVEVDALERELSAYMNRRYGVCVASGLSALRLALWIIGVREKSEVIIPAYSCVALPNAVLQLGAVPVPVDVTLDDWVLNPKVVGKSINKKTKAIITVHMYGHPAKVKELLSLGIPIIEDCAHGFGPIPGQKSPVLGSQANIAIISLYATKFLGAGEGGAILLNNASYASKLRKFRDYSDQPLHNQRGNDKMTDIEGALARNRLRYLPQEIQWRQSLAEDYYANLLPLSKRGFITLPDITEKRFWYRFPVIINVGSVSLCLNKLRKFEIFADKPAENWLGSRINNFPVSTRAYKKIISVPFHAGIKKQHIEYITNILNDYFEGRCI